MAATVLLVANDKTVTDNLAEPFNKKEFSILPAHSGRQAAAQIKARRLDVVILDATAPRLNSKRLCRTLRAGTRAILIVLVMNPNKTDQLGPVDLILPKSLTPKKLLQRVRTALDNRPPREIRVANLTLDVEKRRVVRGSKPHKLTPKEFEMLKLFMERSGEVISRRELMKKIWETDYLGDTRTLDVHIRWLREKIEDDASKPKRLITVRKQGYHLQTK